jgi:hypothetical protein
MGVDTNRYRDIITPCIGLGKQPAPDSLVVYNLWITSGKNKTLHGRFLLNKPLSAMLLVNAANSLPDKELAFFYYSGIKIKTWIFV